MDEIVKIRKGIYSELTQISDSRGLLFKFKKQCQWNSIPLIENRTTVPGFEQGFARLYDVKEDAFFFSMVKEYKPLDVKEILSKKSEIWDGNSQLSTQEVITICDKLIERVIQLSFQNGFVSYHCIKIVLKILGSEPSHSICHNR